MAEDCTQSAPSNSVQAFNLLFAIENALREFIIESLSRFAGPKWYKTRLPGDVLKKYREGQQYERATPWIELVPHHPIYYVEFSDLRKIIEQNNNWADVFKDLFVHKGITSDALFGIEPIRNKVTHNRIIGDLDLKHVAAAYDKMRTLMGPSQFEQFLSRSNQYVPIFTELSRLEHEMKTAFESTAKLRPLSEFPQWDRCANSWWFDEEYLGKQVKQIEAYYDELRIYSDLPRGWGKGLEIERWVQRAEFSEITTSAHEAICDLLKQVSRM